LRAKRKNQGEAMAAVVSLREIVDTISIQPEGGSAYLDPDSGEILEVSEEELRLAEGEEDAAAAAPEWQQPLIENARKVLASDRLLPLPTQFDIHEWAIMERFADEWAIARQRELLLEAIHGRGAFRRFKGTIRRLEIEKDWYRFRDAAVEAIAKEWLESHGIEYR
jgi:hypothetical protein